MNCNGVQLRLCAAGHHFAVLLGSRNALAWGFFLAHCFGKSVSLTLNRLRAAANLKCNFVCC